MTTTSTGAYRALLRLYPRRFRDEYEQWIGPDKDYGAPPGNPPVPTGPGYMETQCSLYSQYGP